MISVPGCEVTVRLTEGDAMISVPGITDCLPSAFRYSSRQVKWRIGWECLPFAMIIQRPQFCGVCRCASSLLPCGGTKTLARRRGSFR